MQTKEDYELLINKIDEKANLIIAQMPSNLTKYGKYKYLAKKLCEITDYNYEYKNSFNEKDYTLVGAFLDKSCVCTGYSYAYKYLCRKVGLFCQTIDSHYGEGHCWNVIKLNNELYYIDVTWMDSGDITSQEVFSYDTADIEHQLYLNSENNFDDRTIGKAEFIDVKKQFLETGNINWKKEKYLLDN